MSDKLQLSVRVDLPGGARIGPGQAALMRAIEAHGSLKGAAESLGMSYPKAMKLVANLNSAFAKPVIHQEHGGKQGGGSGLTETGSTLLTLLDDLNARATSATTRQCEAIKELM